MSTATLSRSASASQRLRHDVEYCNLAAAENVLAEIGAGLSCSPNLALVVQNALSAARQAWEESEPSNSTNLHCGLCNSQQTEVVTELVSAESRYSPAEYNTTLQCQRCGYVDDV